MATTFTELMAISKSNTDALERDAESKLADKRRREAERRKQQEAQEKRDREEAKRRREQYFLQQKREEERKAAKEREERQLEEKRQRREEKQRDKLLYGSKGHNSGHVGSQPVSRSSSAQPRKRASPDNDDGSNGGAIPLTREEKRAKKVQAERDREFRAASTRRSTHSALYKPGKKLRGGAVDIVNNSPSAGSASSSGSGSKSVRERLTAMPNTLMKLNTVKRDLRTIDEILQDRARERGEKQTLSGDAAKAFDDFFTDRKKPTIASRSVNGTPTKSPAPARSTSGTPTPSAPKSAPAAAIKHRPSGSASTLPSFKKTAPSSSKPKPVPSAASTSKRPLSAPATSRKAGMKRPNEAVYESDYLDEDEYEDDDELFGAQPPSKKHRSGSFASEDADIMAEIRGMFRRDRSSEYNNDIFSDDEDMEAGASDLEREEFVSERVAKREDAMALKEEKRREEEKRKRKASASGRV